MSGMEIILPMMMMGASAVGTGLQMSAQAKAQKAAEEQARAQMAQSKLDAERKIAELSRRGHMADRAARAKLAAAEAETISKTGEGMNTAFKGVLAAMLGDEQNKYGDQARTIDADKEFKLKTGQRAIDQSGDIFGQRQLATAVGGLADLLNVGYKTNAFGSASKTGSSSAADPWKARTVKIYS